MDERSSYLGSRINVHSRMAPDGSAPLAGTNGLQWHDLNSREVTTLKEPGASYFSPDDIARREAYLRIGSIVAGNRRSPTLP